MVSSFKKIGPCPASFCLFSSFSQYNDQYSTIIDYIKAQMMWDSTQDCRMLVAEVSTELGWRPPTCCRLKNLIQAKQNTLEKFNRPIFVFHLRLPSYRHGFESQANHECFNQYIFNLYHVEKTIINKKRPGLANFFLKKFCTLGNGVVYYVSAVDRSQS